MRRMPGPYRSAREHTDDAIGLIAQLVDRQIRAHRALGILPAIKDEFSGTFVSGGEVEALLAGGRPLSDETLAALDRVDATIAARAERIENRLEASRAAGEPLPFDTLRRALALTPTEERALWVLIAVELDPRMRQLMRYLVNEANRIHADVGLLEILVYSDPATRDLLIRELAPDATLLRTRLIVEIGSRRQIADAPYLLRPLKVARRVLELVTGHVRLDPEIAGHARLVASPEPGDRLIMPAALLSRVNRLVANACAHPDQPAIILAGKGGAGRRALAQAAAARCNLGALLIDSQ